MENNDTVQLALTWSERKVFSGKSFDDKLELDGIPLGWFYKKFFLPNVMPRYVNPTQFICMKRKMTLFHSAYFSLSARLLPLLLLLKERRKMKAQQEKAVINNKHKVLFLSYSNHVLSNGRIFRIQNIIDDVERDKLISPFVLFAEPLSSSKSLKNSVYEYCSDTDKARKESQKLYQEISQLPEEGLSEAFKIGSTSVFKEYAAAYRMYFSRHFLFILTLMYELSKTIIENEKVSAVVLTSPNSMMERCLIAAASKKGIPAIVIQHGIGMGRLVDKRIPIHFAVFGDFHAEQLIRNGALPGHVHKVGPVIFDDIINYHPQQKTKMVLVATAPIVEDDESSKKEYFTRMEYILKEMSAIDGEVVVKLHPREKYKKEYIRIISRLSNVILRDQETPREEFYRLMSECSSFVHFGTTAALEAMVLNKPVVTINMKDSDVNSPIAWLKDASIFLSYKDDVKAAVKRSLTNEKALELKRQKYIRQFCGEVDGKAHLRVTRLIYSLLGMPKRL